jgi:hypothetical protein
LKGSGLAPTRPELASGVCEQACTACAIGSARPLRQQPAHPGHLVAQFARIWTRLQLRLLKAGGPPGMHQSMRGMGRLNLVLQCLGPAVSVLHRPALWTASGSLASTLSTPTRLFSAPCIFVRLVMCVSRVRRSEHVSCRDSAAAPGPHRCLPVAGLCHKQWTGGTSRACRGVHMRVRVRGCVCYGARAMWHSSVSLSCFLWRSLDPAAAPTAKRQLAMLVGAVLSRRVATAQRVRSDGIRRQRARA